MISNTEILDALARELAALGRVPEIYRDRLPEDFVRPSYFLSAGTRETQPATRWTLEVKQPISVLCIGTLDEDGNTATDELDTMGAEVAAVLAAGFLRVGTRALHIQGQTEKRAADDGEEVTFTLAYFDEVPEEGDTQPPAEQIHTTTTIEEG